MNNYNSGASAYSIYDYIISEDLGGTKAYEKLNKFERTRLLSARAYEISMGSKPAIKVKKGEAMLTKDYVKVAEEELDKNKLELEVYKNK